PQRPPISLLEPSDSGVFSKNEEITFSWSGGGTLEENQYFDLRVWKEGAPNYGIVDAYASSHTLRGDQIGSGEYYWSIAVMDRTSGQPIELVPQAPPRKIIIN
ncbi:MAG: hypothetical protein ACPGWR_07595, partial [Ardenticatenaceae bacterium]